jgi:hypothetical protein
MVLDLELLGLLTLFVVIVVILTYYRRTVRALETQLGRRQTGAYNIGARQVRGDFAQILGTFGILGEYEELVFLSTSSRQASLDLLGVKPDSIDFIELKKKGAASLQLGERRIRQLVEQKKVSYRILEVELPEMAKPRDRM